MMELLEFIFQDFWHFLGFLYLMLAFLQTIESVTHAINERKKTRMKFLEKEIEQLKATIKKDREAISDYLNELTIKKKDNE